MREQRQYHRVGMTETCTLTYQNSLFQGQVNNISLNGAVASFGEHLDVPLGSICQLTIHLKDENPPLLLNVEIIHCTDAMVGMRFVPLDEKGQNRLVHLVGRFTSEPHKLAAELETLKWHITNYLRRAS